MALVLLVVGAGWIYRSMSGNRGEVGRPDAAAQAAGNQPPIAATNPEPTPAPESAPPAGPTPVERAQTALLAGGAVELILVFPDTETNLGQPLLTTGFTGCGDSLYVNCLPDGLAKFGWDHWGSQPLHSPAVKLVRGVEHRVRISLGRKIEGRGITLRGELRVWLDGEPVFSQPADIFPCPAVEVFFGENPTGMSTSQAKFFGQFIGVEVVEAGPPPPTVP